MIAAACVAAPRVRMICHYVRSGRPWVRASIIEYCEMWRALNEHAFRQGWGAVPYPGEDWEPEPWVDPVTGRRASFGRSGGVQKSRFLPKVHKPKKVRPVEVGVKGRVMCHEAVTYVKRNSEHRNGAYIVLLMLAEDTPRDGFGWWKIGYPALAEEANLTERQVKRVVLKLAESGEIAVEWSKGRHANRYRVAMSPGEVENNRKTFALVKPEVIEQRMVKRPKQVNSVKMSQLQPEKVYGHKEFDAVVATVNSDIFDNSTVTFSTVNSDILVAPVEGAIGGGVSPLTGPVTGPELPVKRKDSLSSTFDVSECVATLPLQTFPVDRGAYSARERSTQPNNWVAVWSDFKRRVVDEAVDVTGDAQSLRRFGQLFDVCDRASRLDLWDLALLATKSAVDRSSALARPGAYFQATLGKLCADNGVLFPFRTKAERCAVKADIAASTASALAVEVAKKSRSRSP